MKKTVLVFGCIAGLIVSSVLFVTMIIYKNNPEFKGSMLIGFTSMFIAFAFILVGIKNFRDKYNNGIITFGKGLQIGLLIALIASTFYVITWAIEYNFVFPDYMKLYGEKMMAEVKSNGESEIEIDKKVKEMNEFIEMYKKPHFFILMTYMEILPIGILVSLLGAFIFKRKEKLAVS
jgi:hypothetical protein